MRKAKRRSWRAWALVSKNGKKLGVASIMSYRYAIYQHAIDAMDDRAPYQRAIPVLITEVKK